MNNKQLYIISNQQRFTFNSWKVIVPYSHVHFPVYLTNPHQLTYRKAAYIRALSYNYSIGQQTFTFDMGVHLNPTLPNVGLYNQEHTLTWSHKWSSYPSMNNRVMYENNYNNINLPYLPVNKYHGYNNSGNRVFYDLMVHTLHRRYYNKTAKTYVTSGLDNIISIYTPLTAGILNHPSCIYYLLSPQLYHTLLLTYKGQIKTPMTYLRTLLHEYIYTTLWSINFTRLWTKLSQMYANTTMHVNKLHYMYKKYTYYISSTLYNKYMAIMCTYSEVNYNLAANFLYTAKVTKGVMRIPITTSLVFLSALQLSIPKKRLCGMGSWGVNYLEYYAPRIAAAMHGTGITSKLPMNKYTRVTGSGQGGRVLSSRLYKTLMVLPFTLHMQLCIFSYARILQYMAPYSYESGNRILQHQLQLYTNQVKLTATKVQFTTMLSLWANVWVKLYKQSLVRYAKVYVARKQPKLIAGGNFRRIYKKHQLPYAHKLWYNRMLPKKNKKK